MANPAVKKLINDIYKDKAEKINPIQSGKIISLVGQSSGIDYYDIEINGIVYKNVPCPIPSWLDEQLRKDLKIAYIKIDSNTLKVNRRPVFARGESVQVTFANGNKNNPKINLETSGKKYKEYKIVYI